MLNYMEPAKSDIMKVSLLLVPYQFTSSFYSTHFPWGREPSQC